MALGNKVFKGGIWLSGASYARFGLSFAVQILMARILAPEIFGDFAVIVGIAEILFVLAVFSPPFAVIRYQYCDEIYPTALRLAWGLAATIALIAFTVVFIVFLSGGISNPLLAPCTVLVVARAIRMPASIHEVWIEKKFNYKIVSLTILATATAGSIIGLGSAVMGLGTWALVFRELAEALSYCTAMLFAARGKVTGNFNKSTSRLILTYGAESIGSRIVSVLYTRSPALLLGWHANSMVTGLYDRANYLATVQNTVLTPVTHRVSMAVYGKLQYDPVKLSEALYWHLFISLRWSLPVGLLLFSFSEDLLAILFGTPWRPAAPFLSGLAFWVAFQPACTAMQVCSQAIGSPSAVTVSSMIGLGGIIAGYFGGRITGYWPAIAWANSIAVFIQIAYLTRVLINKDLIIEFYKILKYPILVICVLCAILSTPIVISLSIWFLLPLVVVCWVVMLIFFEQKEFVVLKLRLFAK